MAFATEMQVTSGDPEGRKLESKELPIRPLFHPPPHQSPAAASH